MIKKLFYLFPLSILVITILYASYIVSTTEIMFSAKHHLGIMFIVVCIIAMMARKDIGIYFTGITLLIGSFNLIAFTPTIEAYSFGFGFNDSSITSFKIQLFSFMVLVLYLIVNGKYIVNTLKSKKEV